MVDCVQIFNHTMSFQQEKVVNKTTKCKLVNSIIELIFEEGHILFGGAVRDYQLAKKKIYPADFDIGVDNVNTATQKLLSALKFCFDIEIDEMIVRGVSLHSKIHLKYKFANSIDFYIDISNKNVVGSNIDFDVNGVYMTNNRTYHLIESLPINSFSTIINQIDRKRFKVLKTYKKPQMSRIQNGIEENSKKLIEFIKIKNRVCKMLNRGWKLDNQKIENIFEPCLITLLNVDENEQKCTICNDLFNKYEMKLACCGNIICFVCALGHIKARFGNTEIPCPYCRGDPFGWDTISKENGNENHINNFFDPQVVSENVSRILAYRNNHHQVYDQEMENNLNMESF